MKKIIILLFIAVAFLTMGFASMRMDMRMGGSSGPVVYTYVQYRVSDGIGGWENYRVSDGVGGWENYMVAE